MAKETKQFQAEVKEILDLMVHSLYSHREIFLRELVSNASDALDKLRFEEAANSELKTSGAEKHIRLTPNKDEKTLTISDTGVGMSYDEVLENLGTIARSGTKEFLKKAKDLQDSPELIGQFGVGFYSSFMVADKVTVVTQKAGLDEAVIWESTGDGSFSIDKTTRPEGNGTTITLHLKDFGDDESAQDFTDQWTLKSTIKKYSDFIDFPIKMEVVREEPELDKDDKPIEGKTKTTIEDETLNSRKAVWLKDPSQVSEEEYNEFYKHVTHDWSEPTERIYYKAEGAQEFTALMFIPSQQPFDYNYRDTKWGLSLYVNRVFIMDNCEELLPPYFRFVKGVIEANDLSLNVSREILQKDRQIQAIKKAVVSKLIRSLKQMMSKDREKYEGIWKNFGATLKEGLANDVGNKDKLQDLALFHSNETGALTTLKEYVERMKEKQKEIYYITGESIKQVECSPYLEMLKEKGFEVLYCVDPVDEWVMQSIAKYDEKDLRSITKEGLELDDEDEKKAKEKEIKTKEKEYKGLIDTIQGAVAENVKEVKISPRLVDSPCCLVSGAYDPSARMERMMEAMGQSMPKSKRIMEINPDHPVFAKMKGLTEDKQKVWAEILYNQALLTEGSPIEDPLKFSKQIASLMTETNA
ncbi:molecular chaperone HtpG [Pseudobacteriovorax antillogorgiicola]|uniref:Chaperone protein HtpG n=1 Tax=Pseudobacteriovorax antillogorgiicola TaxID=1513793 RepID=A0A1Y6C0V3_9BACT|nr:molecular chaperone HtpG [Pseudobacteriovorax antillogorgiicola]TCS50647.1 molecular chaperone HtpG [Pseudobacteriovorax antillogorgiicola]SMF39673.1 molecular chaperone HtpG [Pseudobacteriovorax antillogorgiicola]